MADKTKIPWTDATLNPLSGCTKIKIGCKNCCALRSAKWVLGMKSKASKKYEDVINIENGEWNGNIRYFPKEMWKPDTWTKPRLIFLQIMGDLFHPGVDFKWIDEIFSSIKRNEKHIFQILTKRPERMFEYFTSREKVVAPNNVWLGISVSIQEDLETMYPYLSSLPAIVHFLSVEPMLGRVSLYDIIQSGMTPEWVIIGGESGRSNIARPFDPEWAKSLIKECKESGIKVFMKQTGTNYAARMQYKDKRGEDMNEWEEELQIREYPNALRLLYR